MLYYSFKIPTNRTDAENMEILRQIVFTEPLRWFFHYKHFKGKPFWGGLTEHRFKVMPVIKGRNSFLPVIQGEITPGNPSTVLVKMRPHFLLLAVLAVWLVAVVVTTIHQPNSGGPVVLLILFPVTGVVYFKECQKARGQLESYLK